MKHNFRKFFHKDVSENKEYWMWFLKRKVFRHLIFQNNNICIKIHKFIDNWKVKNEN
jgi:hypothetical protein